MNTKFLSRTTTSIKVKISELKNRKLQNLFKNEMTVSLLEKMTRNTYRRIGMRMLIDYERIYTTNLNKFLNKFYEINSKKVENLDKNEIKKIESISNESVVQMLVNYQPLFNRLERYLKVENLQQLSILEKVIKVNTNPLENKKISEEDFLNLISELPWLMYSDFRKHNLVPDFEKIEYCPIRHEDREGIGIFFSKQKTSYGYGEKETLLPILAMN